MLQAQDLQSGYGEIQVLYGLNLEVPAHQVVTLLGRNGMGKTTTVRTLMGMLPLKGGAVWLDGTSIGGQSTHGIARLGVGLVPEGRRVFKSLSVYENLVATERRANNQRWTLEKVFTLFPRLKDRRNQSARTLSGGEQQMLSIGRALMTNPKLLILDEATEGLAPVIRQEIWACLDGLKNEGQTILLIDKNLGEMRHLVDQHNLIEKGRVVWSGTPASLDDRPELVSQYLGV